MPLYELIISIAWIVFIVVWLAGMVSAKRTVKRPWYQMWILRVGILVAVVALVHYHVVNTQQLQPLSVLNGATHSPLLGVLGALLTVLGVALAIWARVYLGRNWGMPQTLKENPELVTTGPYAYVRHPIYTGVLLGFVGSTLINPWWGFIAIVGCIYFIWSALGEEKIMTEQFGDTYPAYKARTKMFVPFIL